MINDSYTVNTKSLNKTLQLPSSFDIYTSDAYTDSYLQKSSEIDRSG